MTEGLRRHLPTIIVISLVGIATGAIALGALLNAVPNMTLETFSTLIFIIPCAIMLVCSLLITMTASEIGRHLYLIVVGICLATGIVAMIVTSGWLSDPAIAKTLFDNSGTGEPVVVPLQSPFIMLRDIAAFFVVGTVGCIAGAWIGSRLHPMTATKAGKKKRK